MKPQPLLLGDALIFWGWQTGLWIFAIIMAIILESARFFKSRWDFSLSEFSRVSDVCTMIFVGMVVWLFVTTKPERIIFIVLQWLPISYFPLMATQGYSAIGKVDIRALSLILRKQSKTENLNFETRNLNLAYLYFVVCILSASVANVRKPWFYIGITLLSLCALWSVRSKRFSPILWLFIFIMVSIGGYAGHIGLHQLQLIIEQKGIEWFINLNDRDADPYRSITAIGELGTLKFSDRILFRVWDDSQTSGWKPKGSSILLREASYNLYEFSKWFAAHASFIAVRPQPNKTAWRLSPSQVASRKSQVANHQPTITSQQSPATSQQSLTISSYLYNDKGLLKLPINTFQIEKLPVSTMEINPLGTVRVKEGPKLITYQVRFSDTHSLVQPPDNNDLSIPKKEAFVINQIVEELELSSKSPEERLKCVNAFFQKNFKYSLTQETQEDENTPLSDFLLNSRAGHCEYFATATVLMLRATGIPARYTTGYLVHEFSKLENRFLVRESDAHAWALVFLNGSWHNFDTTPSLWVYDAQSISPWKSISDIWSWLMYRFSDWRWKEGKDELKSYLVWLLIPLILILARRLYFRKGVKRVRLSYQKNQTRKNITGADSEFYLIEKQLTAMGFLRYPWEPLSDWIKRIETSQSDLISVRSLYPLLKQHYCYRFDPKGMTQEQKRRFVSDVQLWLEQNFHDN